MSTRSYHDQYPDSPVTFLPLTEDEKVKILNRIDQEWQCDKIITAEMSQGKIVGYVFCEDREHDPFTDRCYHHGVSGHLPGGSI